MYNNDLKLMERVNVLQKQVLELGMQWEQESQAANDCIVEILESYMEFVSVVKYAMNFADMPYKIEKRLLNTIKQRENDWQPILETARATQKEKKNGEVILKKQRKRNHGK